MNNNQENEKSHPRLILVVGIFDGEKKATSVVENLLDKDFPADRISLLHSSAGPGDDMLGLSYSNSEERVKVWGKYGVFWGALWGLLTGASGMFIVPGLGALFAIGPIVGALGGAFAGAAIGGGAAVVTELASALHRIGIPEDELASIHNAIEQGQFVVILHCSEEEAAKYTILLNSAGAGEVDALPVII